MYKKNIPCKVFNHIFQISNTTYHIFWWSYIFNGRRFNFWSSSGITICFGHWIILEFFRNCKYKNINSCGIWHSLFCFVTTVREDTGWKIFPIKRLSHYLAYSVPHLVALRYNCHYIKYYMPNKGYADIICSY